jgi:hypothetical protein
MERLTKAEREALFKARFILIPSKLAREALRLKIDIQDTVIEALRWRIHNRKKAFFLKQPESRVPP